MKVVRQETQRGVRGIVEIGGRRVRGGDWVEGGAAGVRAGYLYRNRTVIDLRHSPSPARAVRRDKDIFVSASFYRFNQPGTSTSSRKPA